MTNQRLDRRNFHRLSAAALGGLAAGGLIGCSRSGGGSVQEAAVKAEPAPETELVKTEVHLCRGLNDCKGLGKGGKNECRGQGSCATAKEHSCGGQNDCKGLGGCGETVGKNDCKGQGGCAVPLMEGAWKTLRERKEGVWKEKKLPVGAAPEPAKAE